MGDGSGRPHRSEEPQRSVDGQGRFGETGLAVVRVGLDYVEDTATEVLVDEAESDLLEGSVDRRDLREDVDAVGVLVDEALQATDLAFDLADG